MKTYIEQLAQKLGALYGAYGYMAYSMSKFEEYELYLRNKDFLISDRVLTFTDTGSHAAFLLYPEVVANGVHPSHVVE